MGMKGVEPLLLTEPDPKSGAAASYATCPLISILTPSIDKNQTHYYSI